MRVSWTEKKDKRGSDGNGQVPKIPSKNLQSNTDKILWAHNNSRWNGKKNNYYVVKYVE